MFKFLALISVAFLSFAVPSIAQEDADAALKEMMEGATDPSPSLKDMVKPAESGQKEIKELPADDANYAERLELSKKMHEIWPIRPKIEKALDALSAQIEPTKRLEFKSGMRKAISFEALEEASIDAMADIYSAAELKAMIAFYGSKEGRAVSFKTGDYEAALRPVMTKMIDKALLDSKIGQ